MSTSGKGYHGMAQATRPKSLKRKPVISRQLQEESISHTATSTAITYDGGDAKFDRLYSCICWHCRKGVDFGDELHRCGICKVSICGGCRSAHDTSHANHLVSIITKKLEDVSLQGEKCSICEGDFASGFNCIECSQKVCFTCSKDKAGSIYLHAHKTFVFFTYQIGGISERALLKAQGTCTQHESRFVLHCSGCYSDIDCLTSTAYFCYSCPAGLVGDFCSRCALSAKAGHDATHVWKSLHVALRPHEEVLKQAKDGGLLRCSHCDFQAHVSVESKPQVEAHGHSELSFIINDRLLQWLSANEYRACGTKKLLKFTPPAAGTNTGYCNWCNNDVSSRDIQWCVPCLQESIESKVCNDCFDMYASFHWHGRDDFVSFGSFEKLQPLSQTQPRLYEIFLDTRTNRRWFYSSKLNTRYTTFEAPILLNIGFVYYMDSVGKGMYVNIPRQLAVSTSHLARIDPKKSTHVQWRPRRLPNGWRVAEEPNGRCKAFDMSTGRLYELPPGLDVEDLDPAEVPYTEEVTTTSASLDPISTSQPASQAQASQPLSQQTSTLPPNKPSRPLLQNKKSGMSKLEMIAAGVKILEVGVSIGAALAGVSASNVDFSGLVPTASVPNIGIPGV